MTQDHLVLSIQIQKQISTNKKALTQRKSGEGLEDQCYVLYFSVVGEDDGSSHCTVTCKESVNNNLSKSGAPWVSVTSLSGQCSPSVASSLAEH